MTLPRPARDWALFLDFDGTLAEIAEHPDDVNIHPPLPSTLAAVSEALDGALAIVSGRPLRQIDALLAPLTLPVAGLHGLERRDAGGRVVRAESPAGELESARRALAEFVRGAPDLVLEDKGLTLALHFRRAPTRRAECRRAVDRALAKGSGALHVLEGKMVYEIKPTGVDKGKAIAAFLGEPPFAGRVPVFAGDDVTDEDGFALVNGRGGVSIRVGDGTATRAGWRAASVDEFLDWLDGFPDGARGLATAAGKNSRG
jgi:trehalose 6-phosphate phosphatase